MPCRSEDVREGCVIRMFISCASGATRNDELKDRIGWGDHVALAREMRNACRVMFDRLEEKSNRDICTWEYNIKIVLRRRVLRARTINIGHGRIKVPRTKVFQM